MTTIAANTEMMAADTQMDDDGLIYHIKKIYRVNDDLVGFAGEVAEGLRFVNWYFRHEPGDFDDEFSMNETVALVLTKDKKLLMFESHVPMEVLEGHTAIGSGSGMALVAMDCGHSPSTAIMIASRRDSATGSKVITELL